MVSLFRGANTSAVSSRIQFYLICSTGFYAMFFNLAYQTDIWGTSEKWVTFTPMIIGLATIMLYNLSRVCNSVLHETERGMNGASMTFCLLLEVSFCLAAFTDMSAYNLTLPISIPMVMVPISGLCFIAKENGVCIHITYH